jgi:2-polyprenyl-6-methoxyphenol hydroxylase-like FAD-dependent oxidoreductase
MLHLLLARYGLTDKSLLCVDLKPGTLKSGQADGIQPRTLEVFKTLGLSDEIENEACQMWEFAFWNASDDPATIIERRSVIPEVIPPARFPYEATIHQGRVERIIETDLLRYSARGVVRNTKLVSLQLDDREPDFPVVAEIDTEGMRRTIRTKHLIGADGAHSTVRRSLGLELEGQSLDYIWGVVDLVVDTNFPDIRRRCAIHSPAGSVMVIPRERIDTGDYLTRLYVQVPGVADPGSVSPKPDADLMKGGRGRRSQVTLEGILKQVQGAIKPYYLRPKDDDAIDWWAAYQIGQRVCPEFIVKDKNGVGRVFIVGDGILPDTLTILEYLTNSCHRLACHTHSPKVNNVGPVTLLQANYLISVGWSRHECVNDGLV